MGRSHADKERRRTERLEPLPSTEKALKIAQIKRKEGRILNADERHAVKMQGPVGASLKLCEVVRCKTTTKEDRAAAIDEAFALFSQEGWEKYCRSPQTSRVIQSCVKNGSTEQVKVAYDMCLPVFATLCSDPFAAYVVCSIIRHASHVVYAEIVEALCELGSQVVDTKPGICIVDTAYISDWCTARQKNELICACVGTKEEFKRTQGYPILGDMPKTLTPRIVERVDKMLAKGKIDSEVMHAVVLVGVSVSEDKAWHKEVFDFLRPSLKQLCVASHAGSVLSARVFAYLPLKERKVVLAELADDAVTIAGNKFGAPFMSALIDHQLDVQVLHKYIVVRWLENMGELLQPAVFRNFGKLILRLATCDLKKKVVCVPEVWRRSYPLVNDEATAKRHATVVMKYLPEFASAVMATDAATLTALGVRVLLKELVHGPLLKGEGVAMPEGFEVWAEQSVKRRKDDDEEEGPSKKKEGGGRRLTK